ncbi:hypothetical protein LZQ00_05755 [Sphingobacterium sp. SRCM116780]|uniref:hypothetical protein n=1 Tax=Sphingobacterium sp. SRCM116780 TaxID=2907623 RepID=UPI001F255F2C|nr:hypothetical protein [Sphingobacterium sp. SRCM116780]UIR57319.1 hypothetical protein LZQ00_05755 [Sphingobacterium sp. SRCM116780]
MRLILFVFGSLMVLSCHNTSKSENTKLVDLPWKDQELPKEEVDSLWRKAINDGDFGAYNNISNNYLLRLKNYELYYYSLLMANKYQCPEAYEHLYFILTTGATVNGVNMISSDSITKNQAIFYLLKAHELGYEGAKSSIHEIFGDSILPPKSDVYLKKIQGNYKNLKL